MTTAAASATNPDYPEFPILRRHTVEYREVCSEDGRTTCVGCKSPIHAGMTYISVFGLRLCTCCYRCAVCMCQNDGDSEPIKRHGVTRYAHGSCIFGAGSLTGHHIETEYERIRSAELPAPGFYRLRGNPDAPRVEFSEAFAHVLSERELAEIFANQSDDESCALCDDSERDYEVIPVAGGRVHSECARCRVCQELSDDRAAWLIKSDANGDAVGYVFAMCAYCFSLLYELHPAS